MGVGVGVVVCDSVCPSPQYLKLEELNEQSRLNQWQINCRSSMLAIMLHHTVDHQRDPPTADISTLTEPPDS